MTPLKQWDLLSKTLSNHLQQTPLLAQPGGIVSLKGRQHNDYAIIGSDNGCQLITWTNTGLSLIGPLEKNLCEIFIEENVFEKWQQFFFASICQIAGRNY